jgi:hypothetical protein
MQAGRRNWEFKAGMVRRCGMRASLLALCVVAMLSAKPVIASEAPAWTPLELAIQVGDVARAQIGSGACVGFNRRHDTVGPTLFSQAAITKNGQPSGQWPSQRAPQYTVKRGDIFQLTLSQALVADIRELSFFGRKRGDIAIVVNVRERGSGDDFDFSPGSENTGRVVFFQRNVAAGAPLNLANLPVYGPARYEGKPLMVVIHIVEIDGPQSALASGLVDTLANLSKTVTPVNSAAISVLSSLGGTLLRSNRNDILAEYRAEFLPAESEHPDVRTLALEYGNYAFIVTRDPTAWHSWEELRFDQRNARLFSGPATGNSCGSAVKDKTWLTLQVNRGLEPVVLPTSNTLGNLVQSLSRESENRVQLLKRAADELTTIEQQRTRFRHYLSLVRAVNGQLGKKIAPPAEVVTEIKALLNNIDSSLQGKGSDIPFDRIQSERLVSELRLLLDDETQRRLFSVDVFNKGLVERLLTDRFTAIEKAAPPASTKP